MSQSGFKHSSWLKTGVYNIFFITKPPGSIFIETNKVDSNEDE